MWSSSPSLSVFIFGESKSIFQAVVESKKVFPEHPFLEAKHPQLPPLFLTELIL